MENRLGRIIAIVFVICVLSFCCLKPIFSYSRGQYYYHRFQYIICDNLINAGYLSSRSECVLSGSQYEIISGMFPIGEVDYDYVMAGMEGFEIIDEFRYEENHICSRGDELIRYDIEIVPSFFFKWADSFEFGFCDNTLIDLYWHN